MIIRPEENNYKQTIKDKYFLHCSYKVFCEEGSLQCQPFVKVRDNAVSLSFLTVQDAELWFPGNIPSCIWSY